MLVHHAGKKVEKRADGKYFESGTYTILPHDYSGK